MRFLADENFPKRLVMFLRSLNHDVVWARTAYPRWKDKDLIDLAELEGRVTLTLDKDFVQIALQRREPVESSGVVLLKVHPATVENLQLLMETILEKPERWIGHVTTVEPDRVEEMRVERRSRPM